jgi:alpha-beta hydrolase superfamily lysophospholipase
MTWGSTPGAQLRGTRPPSPHGVVLILHGGAERGRLRMGWYRPPVLRMIPFAIAIERRAGDTLAVVRLKNTVLGWNGDDQSPVHDARWALDRIRQAYPGLPIALVGHSMGGRVALHLAGDPDVVAIAALAPWVARNEVAYGGPGLRALLMHGTWDSITSARSTRWMARQLQERGVQVTHVEVEGEVHGLLRQPRRWHRTVRDFVIASLAAASAASASGRAPQDRTS